MKRALPFFAIALTLSGCVTPKGPPSDPVKLEEVIRQIKKDIGEYNAYAQLHANDPRLNTACRGQVSLAVKSVTVSVTTATKVNQGMSAGAELAPLAFFSKATAQAGYSSGIETSQVLTFTLEPVAAQGARVSASPSNLYRALTNLRESLLNASDTEPCLRFPENNQKNTLEFGFTATRKVTGGAGVNLFIFALGTSGSDERIAAHKITIGFVGEGASFMCQLDDPALGEAIC